MKILVTGGTGFVGSHVLQSFQEEGIFCRALVRERKTVTAAVAIAIGDLLARPRDSYTGIGALIASEQRLSHNQPMT